MEWPWRTAAELFYSLVLSPLPPLSSPALYLFSCSPKPPKDSTGMAMAATADESLRHSLLLDRLHSRHLKNAVAAKPPKIKTKPNPPPYNASIVSAPTSSTKKEKRERMAETFEELGLSEDVMGALREMGIEVPTEIQLIGIPAVGLNRMGLARGGAGGVWRWGMGLNRSGVGLEGLEMGGWG